MPTPPALECQKPLFALPEGETWLNNAYMGAMPRAVLEAGHRAVEIGRIHKGSGQVHFT